MIACPFHLSQCEEMGEGNFQIMSESLREKGIYLIFPSLWKHLLVDHRLEMYDDSREIILSLATKTEPIRRLTSETLVKDLISHEVLEVEALFRTPRGSIGYSHPHGPHPDSIDWELISAIEKILLSSTTEG